MKMAIVEILHHLIAPTFWFSETNRRYKIPIKTPQTGALNTDGTNKYEHLLSYSPCSSKV